MTRHKAFTWLLMAALALWTLAPAAAETPIQGGRRALLLPGSCCPTAPLCPSRSAPPACRRPPPRALCS